MATTLPHCDNNSLEALWPHLRPPALTPELHAEADLALDGVLLFHWTPPQQLRVGRAGVDWSGGPGVHQEARAQLHRFAYLAPLASAWRETADERYASAARDYIDDWITAHPTRPNWNVENGDSTLNLSIRVGNSVWPGWLGALEAFNGSIAFDADFASRVLASIEAQLGYLAQHLTPSINWRLAEADALLTTAVRAPQLPGAAARQKLGAQIINEGARLQFLPDGAHIERSPGYHAWMAEVYSYYWRLARARPELGLEIDTGLVRRAFAYWQASLRPNGDFNRLHDCERHPERSHAKLYSAFRDQAGSGEPRASQLPSCFFPDAGQALLRDGVGVDASYVTFDASPWAGSHSHLSQNSLQVDVKGRPMLIDPGVLDYEATNPLMPYGRGTRAHNTVNLNGWNQAPVTRTSTHCGAHGYDYVSNRYEGGYWPSEYLWLFPHGTGQGIWARHDRAMLWAHARYIVVVDTLHYWPTPGIPAFIECNWQFDEGEVALDAAGRQAVSQNPDANLLLRVLESPPGTSMGLHQAESDPPRGWVVGQNAVVPAPQLCVSCEAPAAGNAAFVTLLVPFEGSDAPKVDAEVTRVFNGRRIEIRHGTDSDTVFLGEEPFDYADDGIQFTGVAGLVHRTGDRTHLWLPAPGRLTADGETIEQPQVKTVRS